MQRRPVLSRLAVVMGCATLLAGSAPSVATPIAAAQTVTLSAPTASGRPGTTLMQRGQERPRYSVILI